MDDMPMVSQVQRKLSGYQLEQGRTDLLASTYQMAAAELDDAIQNRDGVYTSDYTITIIVERKWVHRG